MYENYLSHHGIKGQKWGVRRFQNKDGSLTNAGKTRYQRGQEYSVEFKKIADKEHSRLLKTSKEYQKYEKEALRIADKYGLDKDDGGGGDHTRFTEDQLRMAGQRYWDRQEDMDSLDNQFQEKAQKYAREQLIKKYGDAAISDLEHYDNVNGAVTAVALLAGFGGLLLVNFLKK